MTISIEVSLDEFDIITQLSYETEENIARFIRNLCRRKMITDNHFLYDARDALNSEISRIENGGDRIFYGD